MAPNVFGRLDPSTRCHWTETTGAMTTGPRERSRSAPEPVRQDLATTFCSVVKGGVPLNVRWPRR